MQTYDQKSESDASLSCKIFMIHCLLGQAVDEAGWPWLTLPPQLVNYGKSDLPHAEINMGFVVQ